MTAALAWWNERPEDLAACVRGVANVADRIVALDGSYARYPNATIRSPAEQVETIRSVATEVGLECLVLQPDRLWAGQVEKRSYLLTTAALNSDWIAVVDTDHIVQTDRAVARTALDTLDQGGADVVEAIFYTPKHATRSVQESSPSQWHMEQAEMRVWIPHLYRALPGMTVERFHWWISAIKNGQRVWLWSSAGTYPLLSHAAMPVPYTIEHRVLHRTEEQILASRAFLNDRQGIVVPLTGQEDDQPGLPSPAYRVDQWAPAS